MTPKRSHALAVTPPDLAARFRERLAAVVARVRELPPDAVLVWPAALPLNEQVHALIDEWEGRQPRRAGWVAGEAAGVPLYTSADAEHWPAGLSLPLTVREALAVVEREATAVVAEVVAEVVRGAAFVDPELRAAVLARPSVVTRWPWPMPWSHVATLERWIPAAVIARTPYNGTWANAAGHAARAVINAAGGIDEPWPGDAAPLDVARWVQPTLNRLQPDGAGQPKAGGDNLVHFANSGHFISPYYDGFTYRFEGIATLYLAEREVREDLKRPAVAIDAGKRHHDLLIGWRDNPRDGVRHRAAPAELASDGGKVELMLPGHPVQLALPMVELEGLSEGAIRLLRDLRGAKGIRHWCALQRLLSVEGGRTGWVRWTLDEHLAAMGYRKSTRENPAGRAEAAAEVEILTKIELVVYDAANVARHRAPLLLVGDRFERLAGSAWNLEGMELRINDLLYAGVRDQNTGKLGTNWWPVPVELAQIDHVRHAYAHALGMLLAVRFRWDAGDGRAVTRLTGRKLLDLAGIPYIERRAAEAWGKLRRELAELERIGMLAAANWDGEPWTLTGVCCLSSSPWIEDRTARQLRAEDRPVVDIPRTGAELRDWRTARGWSRRETAKRLDLPATTLDKAEAKPETALGAKVATALASWRAG